MQKKRKYKPKRVHYGFGLIFEPYRKYKCSQARKKMMHESNKRYEATQDFVAARYKSAYEENIKRFGKKFLKSFPRTNLAKKGNRFVVSIKEMGPVNESSFSLTLEKELGKKTRLNQLTLGDARLGFEEEAVVVEALKGLSDYDAPQGITPLAELDRFRQYFGKPWANYLLEKIEEQARKNGFSKVKIRRPESLYFYWHTFRREKKETRKTMRRLYGRVANEMGYKRKGIFFVKELKQTIQ